MPISSDATIDRSGRGPVWASGKRARKHLQRVVWSTEAAAAPNVDGFHLGASLALRDASARDWGKRDFRAIVDL